jgi:Uma2 family endonuclease
MILLLDNAVRIPREAVGDFGAFRRWTKSRQYPPRGEIEFLCRDVWVDLAPESLVSNQLRTAIASCLGHLIDRQSSGHFFARGMRLVHKDACLSCEPDTMFVGHEAVKTSRIRWQKGRESLEVIGTPDLVVEIVSETSILKDRVVLRELYAAAGIPEYWLINPLGGQLSFDILRLAGRLSGRRYAATRKSAGWIKSAVFGKSFRLLEEAGDDAPQYKLLVR